MLIPMMNFCQLVSSLMHVGSTSMFKDCLLVLVNMSMTTWCMHVSSMLYQVMYLLDTCKPSSSGSGRYKLWAWHWTRIMEVTFRVATTLLHRDFIHSYDFRGPGCDCVDWSPAMRLESHTMDNRRHWSECCDTGETEQLMLVAMSWEHCQ